MELARQGRQVRGIVHPRLAVARDLTGADGELAPMDETSAHEHTDHGSRGVLDARGDRPDHRPGRGDPRSPRPCRGAPRRAGGGRGLGEDARPGLDDRGAAAHRPSGAPRRGGPPGPRLLEWLADDRFTFLGYREYALETVGDDLCCGRCPAPASASCAPTRTCPARRDGWARSSRRRRPRDPAGGRQGQLPGHGAPPRLPRLRRRQDVRRPGQGRRGAALPRPAGQPRLHRVHHPDPAAAREGGGGAPGRGLRRPQPRRQGADGHAGELPARRVLPHPHRGARPRSPRA